jgi:murein DD-endopeptidase MepM/ murein hydrolase activator NlpD
MSRTPLTQGETAAIYVETISGDTITGSFAGQELQFTEFINGYLTLVGLDAFTEPGFYPLELLSGNGPTAEPFQQDVQVNSGNYGIQYITIPAELNNLLEPEVRAADEAILAPYFEMYTEQLLWSGLFQSPVTDTFITAPYGASRSYNEGPIEIFHTGVDFAGTIGTPIQAPAEGRVIFSDTLPLHGGTLIIDHGIGVMTAYYHLSEILVDPGELVSMGETIAYGGSTGLSSGPHLHWDLRINNVPVNGMQWVEEDIIEYALEPLTNTAPTGGGF